MKKKQGKAFTIVELVIVIAVIAILAAVLIPTFSTVIKKAKVSADEQAAANMNTALSAYAAESGINGTEDLDKVFSDIYGESYAKVLQPQSASYGYHFWYNVSTNRVELALSSALGVNTAQAVSLSLTKSSSVGQFGVRGMVREGYVLLDTAGSRLAETVASFEGMATASDYSTALENLQSIRSDKYDSEVAQGFSAAVDKTAFVTDHGVFRGENATQISFDKGIQTLTGSLFINKEGEILQETLGGDQVVANVSGEVVLPASVNSVGSNALHFGTDSDAVVVVSSDTDVASVFLANSADVAISCGGNVYTIRGDELYCNGEAVEGVSLGYGAPVTAFEIGVQGAETAGGVYSVALDALSGDISLYARNFVSESVNYDSRVTWTLEKAPEGVQISSEGVLSGISAGEIVVRAEAVSDASVAASFTVRVGAVTNVSRAEFTGDCLQVVDGQTTKVTLERGKTASFSYNVYVQKNFDDINVDESFVLTSSAENAVVNDEGTITVTAVGDFVITLEFEKYGITRTYNFTVEEIVTQFDCIEYGWPNVNIYLYKAGNSNAFDITKLWRFTGEHANYGLNEQDISIEYQVISAKNNLPLSDTIISGVLSYAISEDNMIDFEGRGVVRVNISAVCDGIVLNEITVPLEVVDGYNVTTNNELTDSSHATSNKIVLNDIELKNYSSSFIVNGSVLYGNGFTLDGTSASRPAQMRWESLLSVNDAVVDNVKVIGQTFPEITWYGEEYSGYTISLDGDYCELYNSYAYGSRAALNVGCDAYIGNSVLEGGVLANAILDCQNITLEDVTTIQNVDSDAIEGGITEDNIGVGLGLFVNTSFANSIHITLKGDLRQYNWLDSELVNKIKDTTYRAAAQALLKESEDYLHNIGGTDYVNAGIVFFSEVQDLQSAVIDLRDNKAEFPYSGKTYSKLGFEGTIYSLFNGGSGNKTSLTEKITEQKRFDSNDFQRTLKSMDTKPTVWLDNSAIEASYESVIDGNKLSVKLPAGGSFTIDQGNLPVRGSYFGADVTSLLSLQKPVTASESSARKIQFVVELMVSESYDATGTWQSTPITYTYTFVLNSILSVVNATYTVTDGVEGTDYFYIRKSTCDDDCYTAAYILNGLVITDYDAVSGKYVSVDYSNYASLPEEIVIKSFSGGAMSNADQYQKIENSNGKLLLRSLDASDFKRDEKMIVELEYTGYNGNTITITRTYQFTGSTPYGQE